MKTTHEARYIGVSIERSPEEVYSFASEPGNLSKWATGLGESIRRVNGEWVADSPMGVVKIEFAEPNEFGVLDHDVVLESGERVRNSIRVVPNGRGSEFIFILIRRPDTSDDKFSQDAAWVERDLDILKRLLEGGPNDAE